MPPTVQVQVLSEWAIGAWGYRFFESDHDYDIVDELTNDAGFGHDDFEKGQWLVSPKNPVKVRKHMNDGGFMAVWNMYQDKLSNYKMVNLKGPVMEGDLLDSPRYYLMCLGMLAIEHGWKVNRRIRRWLKVNCGDMALNKEKVAQAKKALEEFESGKPYDLGSKGLRDMHFEVMLMSKAELAARGSVHPDAVSVWNTITIRSRARMLHDNKVAMILGGSKEKCVDILHFSKSVVVNTKPETPLANASESARTGGIKKNRANGDTTEAKLKPGVPGAIPRATWREDLRKQNKPRKPEFYAMDSPLGFI